MLRKILAWVLLALTCYTASSNAQSVNYTTGNLINPASWTGTAYGNLPGDCCTGGPSPLYNNQLPGGGISFSYGQATVGQNININQAISGSGVVVRGYNYHWHITTNTANGVDPVYGQVTLMSNTNSPLETFNYNYTNAMNETIFSGTENFKTTYSLAAVSSLNVNFTGRDQNYWAGYYGPKVNHIIVSMNYGVDPCATNPAYSPSCSGFNSVVFSNNLVPNPGANITWGGQVNNSFAINQALTNASAGILVHGFDYGFKANVSGQYCAFELITCWDTRNPSANVGISITDKTGASLYSTSYNINSSTGGLKSYDYQYRFPSSQQYGNLGNFNFTASTSDSASVGYMYARAAYTPDACMINPQSSTSCPGYVAPPVITSAPTVVYTAPTITSTQPATTSTTSVSVGGVELSTSGTISAPDGVPVEAKVEQSSPAFTATSTVSASTYQTSTTTTTAAASSPQEQSKTTASTPNMSLIMSTIGKIQAADKATQAAAVQNANSVVMTSVAKAQEQAMSVVDNLNTMSASSSQASQTQSSGNATQGSSTITQSSNVNSGSVTIQGPTVMSVQALMNMASQTSTAGISSYQPPVVQSQAPIEVSTNNTSSTGVSLSKNGIGISVSNSYGNTTQNLQSNALSVYTPTIMYTQPVFESRSVETNTPVIVSFNPANKTNPVNDAMESKPFILSSGMNEQKMDSVNKNAQTNELAGGVDIAAIAVLPIGFNTYNVALRDTLFYKQEEIYKDQRTVDNVRLLRGLTGASDARHQKMINLQYK